MTRITRFIIILHATNIIYNIKEDEVILSVIKFYFSYTVYIYTQGTYSNKKKYITYKEKERNNALLYSVL
jgi:hypothetical protein